MDVEHMYYLRAMKKCWYLHKTQKKSTASQVAYQFIAQILIPNRTSSSADILVVNDVVLVGATPVQHPTVTPSSESSADVPMVTSTPTKFSFSPPFSQALFRGF